MKFFIFNVLMILSINCFSQNNIILKEAAVDKRVELLSIVYRLAGSSTYNSQQNSKYVKNIDQYFGRYRNHDLIKYVKNNLIKSGINYDAVAIMAISITQPPKIKGIFPITKDFPGYKWTKHKAKKFLKLLNSFYYDTNCELFFKQNEKTYKTVSVDFQKVLNGFDIKWYQNFYGQKSKKEYNTVINLAGGYGGYGPKINIGQTEVLYSILGVWETDTIGNPIFNTDEYLPILLHEFNHSFVNDIVEKYRADLEKSGKIIYDLFKDEMINIGYNNWKTMFDESIVRACVIKYMKDKNFDKKQIQKEINTQLNSGFVWIESLVEALEQYDNRRNEYADFDSFMPELVNYFDKISQNINNLIIVVNNKRPKIISIKPFDNKSVNVDYTINQIAINFNKPMKGGYSIYYGEKGKDAFPDIKNVYYSADKKTLYLDVRLIANKEYQFVMKGINFISIDGFSIKNYTITFKTIKTFDR